MAMSGGFESCKSVCQFVHIGMIGVMELLDVSFEGLIGAVSFFLLFTKISYVSMFRRPVGSVRPQSRTSRENDELGCFRIKSHGGGRVRVSRSPLPPSSSGPLPLRYRHQSPSHHLRADFPPRSERRHGDFDPRSRPPPPRAGGVEPIRDTVVRPRHSRRDREYSGYSREFETSAAPFARHVEEPSHVIDYGHQSSKFYVGASGSFWAVF